MKKFFTLTAIGLSSTFSVASIFTSSIAVRAENQFDVCLKELTSSGVSIEKAQTGCASALIPRDLSYCVRNITQFTSVSGDEALTSCFQVRRPRDLSSCVVTINNTILTSNATKDTDKTDTGSNLSSVTPLMAALYTCRQSLLPARHSECVIGLSRTPKFSNPVNAMETCLSAEDFPTDLFPSYTN